MINIQHNPPLRTALIWAGIALVGVIIIFVPRFIGLERFQGVLALGLLGGFVAAVGIIAVFIFLRLAVSFRRVARKEHILAHWTYTPEEWKGFKEEPARDVSATRSTVIIVAVISVIVGLTLWAIKRDNPLLIVFTVLGILAFTGLLAYLSALATYRRNREYAGEVYISLDGLCVNREVHIWRGIGNRLEKAFYDDRDPAGPKMVFEYSAPGQGERDYYTPSIPVPRGQEETARRIIAQIAGAHLSKSRKG